MKKKIYCTLDTETVGGASTPKGIYHLGGIIHDRKGNIYGCFNLLIAEWLGEVINDDYAKQNIDLYAEMLLNGTATLIGTEQQAIEIVNDICRYHNVGTMCAFNSGFDYEKTYCRELLKGREFIDLWLMALETICDKKSFKKFCAECGRYNPKNLNCRTNAETVFAYLIGNPDYCEEHTALEDSKIELEIFKACMDTHKRFTPNYHLWDYMGTHRLAFPKI